MQVNAELSVCDLGRKEGTKREKKRKFSRQETTRERVRANIFSGETYSRDSGEIQTISPDFLQVLGERVVRDSTSIRQAQDVKRSEATAHSMSTDVKRGE